MSLSRRSVLVAPDAAGGTPISTYQVTGDGDRQAVVIGSADLETGAAKIADVQSGACAGTEMGLVVRVASLLRQVRNTFAAISAGAAAQTPWFDVSAVSPSRHTVQINVAGTVGAYSYQVEASLDGATPFNISGVRNVGAGLNDFFSVTDVPADSIRINFLSAAGTGNIVARYLGTA